MSAESGESIGPAARRAPLPRVAIVLLVTASAVILIAGLRGAAGIIGPAFLAVVLTIVAHPAQVYAQRRGWPTWTGVLMGMAIAYAIVAGLTVALVASLARLATLLPMYKDDAEARLHDIAHQLQSVGVGSDQQQTIVNSFDPTRLTDFILNILGSLASFSSNLILIITLLLFMTLDAASFPSMLRATGDRHRDAVEALAGFADGTRRYLLVSTIFGFIVAVIDTAFLAFAGIPAPFVWGLLAFITNYIPNIGFVVGLAPPALLALLQGGPLLMLLVIVVYCVVNFVIQSLIQPKVVGNAVGLSATVTMLSLIFWAWVLGAVGALLAIPLTLLMKALLVDADPDARWLLPILSSNLPPEAPEEDSSDKD
jgi:AI-2 transport protein TqsA